MLDVKDINAAYGQVKVLNGVSLNVDAGEILCVMGRNGACLLYTSDAADE